MNEKYLLVVDDIEMNREIFKETFDSCYKVLEACNGQEALDILATHEIHLIVTDIYMDDVDGFELIEKIRAQRRYNSIPIIAVTEDNEDIQQRVLGLGANEFICKPYITKLMDYHIENFINEKETEERTRQYYAVFDKTPISFAMFHLIMGEDGEYHSYKIVYLNRAMNKLVGRLEGDSVEEIFETENEDFLEFLRETASAGQEAHKIIHRKEQDRYYDITAYQDRMNYVACVVADVTNQIKEEKRQSDQFYCEMQKSSSNEDNSMLCYCRYNLTTDAIERLDVEQNQIFDEKILQEKQYCACMEKYFDEINLTEDDYQMFSRDGLLALYHSGANERSKEYFARDKKTHDLLYVCLECKILRRPENGDILAFYCTRDWTKRYIERHAMDAILENDYDYAGLIFADTQKRFYIKQSRSKYESDYVEERYDEAVRKAFFRYCVNNNIEEKIQENMIEVIEKHLLLKKIYKTEVDFLNPEDGKIYRKNLRYIYADRDRRIIAINQIDVEAVVRKEKEKKLQLEAALNLAERANNAKSEFLATISHEIRTPMNVVLGLTELAKSEITNAKLVRDYLDKIEISGKHLLHLVNDVLDMSKIESGEFTLHPEAYSFFEFTANIENFILPLCEEKNIAFEVLLNSDLPDIYVDKLRLDQIFINVISNSVKFTDSGGKIVLNLHGDLRENKVYCKFEISDNGIGMSKEFQKELFKPFTQEVDKVTRSVQGTGLGLSIAYGIISKMGGSIKIKSEKNVGSTFYIELALDVARKSRVQEEKVISEKKLLEGKTVLVVEDHPINQMIIGKMLQNQGAKVCYADNGKDGVDTFEASKEGAFDMIFMDIRMPVMDGLQAARHIRALERRDAKEIPIIAMTANAYDEDREKSSRAGINVHLAKPVDSRILYQAIAKFYT